MDLFTKCLFNLLFVLLFVATCDCADGCRENARELYCPPSTGVAKP